MMTTSEKLQIIEMLEDCDTEELAVMTPIRRILEAEDPYLVGVPAAGLRGTLEAHTARRQARADALAGKAYRQRAWEAATLDIMAAGNGRAAW